MPQDELIEPDEIDDMHDAVIVNSIDRYSDISEPASPRAADTLDALAAAVVAEAAAATTSRSSDTDELIRRYLPASDLRLPLTQDDIGHGYPDVASRLPSTSTVRWIFFFTSTSALSRET